MYKNYLRLPSQKDINDNFNPSLFVNKTRLILYLATITIFFTIFLNIVRQSERLDTLPFHFIIKLSTNTMSVIE